ncbi:MAG: cell division protein ZapB [Gemmatimonadota bacterium]|jgi:predicted  nucleic acid-binding Zn-ribbon protein|nr:cell division protein ZapB [Gemmatimonadota bacterium]MDP6529996.1 cell division protein ZapB [Gemmatimonadota bacterium]MDP6802099.1 cell division protein ZapB [Gemmatimonadota bacterium]MDP7032643.1 cell division protein ZapB [Gemmatimonadota bacterium]
MKADLLDRLEKSAGAVADRMARLRGENGALREEAEELATRLDALEKDLNGSSADAAEVESLRKRCAELEKKFAGVRNRIRRMIEQARALEG